MTGNYNSQGTLLTQFGGIKIDLTEELTEVLASTISHLPIEKGVSLTDHRHLHPLVIECKCRISDLPFNPQERDKYPRPGRAKEFFDQLVKSYHNPKPFTFVSDLSVIENIHFLEIRRISTKAHEVVFHAKLQQINQFELKAQFKPIKPKLKSSYQPTYLNGVPVIPNKEDLLPNPKDLLNKPKVYLGTHIPKIKTEPLTLKKPSIPSFSF